MSYRSKRSVTQNPQITCPEDAAKFLREIWNQDTLELREEAILLILSSSKNVMGYTILSTGSQNATIIEPATIFRYAILGAASSFLLAHNHISGSLKPSSADIALTNRIMECSKIMGVSFDDHIILTRDGYLSLREEGEL